MQVLSFLFLFFGIRGALTGATNEFLKIIVSILSIISAFLVSIQIYPNLYRYISNPFLTIFLSNIFVYFCSKIFYFHILKKLYIDRIKLLPSFTENLVGIFLSILRGFLFFGFLYFSYKILTIDKNDKIYSFRTNNLIKKNRNIEKIISFIDKTDLIKKYSIDKKIPDKYQIFRYYINLYRAFIDSNKINFLIKSEKEKNEIKKTIDAIDFKIQILKYYE